MSGCSPRESSERWAINKYQQRFFTILVQKIAFYGQVTPNVYLHQSLTLPTVDNVTVPKTLHFSFFPFFASSWFISPAICCNYSTELHHHRWEKIQKAAESRFQRLGNPWIVLDQNLLPTLQRHHQRYNHALCYHVVLRAAPLPAQTPAPGVGCRENEAAFGTWTWTGGSSSAVHW